MNSVLGSSKIKTTRLRPVHVNSTELLAVLQQITTAYISVPVEILSTMNST